VIYIFNVITPPSFITRLPSLSERSALHDVFCASRLAGVRGYLTEWREITIM